MTTKKFQKFGIAAKDYPDAWTCRMEAYATRDEKTPPTPIVFKDNIFNSEMKLAKNVLEIGCGIGRNLTSVMNLNDEVKYHGIEPNKSMMDNFWNVQDKEKYGNRVTLYSNFESVPSDIKFDIVLSIFTMQHVAYMVPDDVYNATDIFKEIFKFTDDNTIFMMYEHENECPGWYSRFMGELDILPQVFIRSYTGFPDHRDRGEHDLILYRRNR